MAERIYLEDIIKRKRETLANQPYDKVKLIEIIKQLPKRPSFYNALAIEGLAIIGEVKKASPSKGLIKADFHPLELAKIYEGCVDAISVLTEEHYFLGHDDYLREISQKVAVPTLCKDFIIDPIQIYNAKALGASCILLIVAVLSDEELKSLMALAHDLDLDVLVETHTEEEVERALKTEARIIGVNNRNLKTFETFLETTLRLSKMIPSDRLLISESGISNTSDIQVLRQANIQGILVGESFMLAEDMVGLANSYKKAFLEGKS